MKNQKVLILTGAVLLAGLVSCGPTTLKPEKAEQIISGFDTTLTGTVKATYSPNYEMKVDSDNAKMKEFEEKIQKTYNIEADFTEGDLYLHISVADESLVLVYEGSDGYYFVESTLADPIKLADEAATLAKMETLLKKYTKTKAGWIDYGTFLYTGSMTYEHSQFLLDSTNIEVDFMDDTRKITQTEEGGLDIEVPLEYVGYNTDSGISELSPKEGSTGKSGGLITIKTDANGHVLSYVENYEEAELEMPLTTPPPVISLHGSHSFAAEYGVELTKKSTIPHEATFGTAAYSTVDAQNKGVVEVYTCAAGEWTKMTAIKSDTQLKVGDYICVKPTPAGNNQVAYVTYAGSSEAIVMNGYYCFEVVSGDQDLGVTFQGSDTLPTKLDITVTKDAHVAGYELTWFTMANPTVQNPVVDNKLDLEADKTMNEWLAVVVNFESGYELADITFNGGKMTYKFEGPGVVYYCYEAKLPKHIAVNITSKAA